jgi:hypothetical protein
MNETHDYVELPGLTLPVPALDLCLRLEREGWTLKRNGEKLSVTRTTTGSGVEDRPLGSGHETGQTGQTAEKTGQALLLKDREAITKWRHHLLAVCDFVKATR